MFSKIISHNNEIAVSKTVFNNHFLNWFLRFYENKNMFVSLKLILYIFYVVKYLSNIILFFIFKKLFFKTTLKLVFDNDFSKLFP